MKKILFHGSSQIVDRPLYGVGKKTNDYGLGFYCTEDIELAYEWAIDSDRDGYLNTYELDCGHLTILHLDRKEYKILHWLAILLENRTFNVSNQLASEAKEYIIKNFSIPYKEYDLIIGYRADDSYFAFAQDFLSGSISYQQLEKAMKLGNLGKQVVLISPKAFENITFRGYEIAKNSTYYNRKKERDSSARNTYFESKRAKRNKGDLFINQIIDEEMKPDDPRL